MANNHELRGANGPLCFKSLPAEMRLMIWEYLLPGRRILKAMARKGRRRFTCDEDLASNNWEPRWNFQITSVVEYPLLLCICRESRAFALKNGHFVFANIESKEPGMWWGPEDVLLFNREWSPTCHVQSLEGLSGLEHVQHIALDIEQSRYTAFEFGMYRLNTDAGEVPRALCLCPDWDKAASFASLAFSKKRGIFSDDDRPFLPQHFTNIREITFLFDKLWKHSPSWNGRSLPVRREFCDAKDNERVTTLRAGSSIEVATQNVKSYIRLWDEAGEDASVLAQLSPIEPWFDDNCYVPLWPFAILENFDMARVSDLIVVHHCQRGRQVTTVEEE